MLCCRLCLVFLLSIFCCVENSFTKKCVPTDKEALLKLKDGFIDERNFLNLWKGEDCCKWEGISCNNLTGHVTKLDLQYLSLGGKIDSSVCKLQHLTLLDLTFNELGGIIPKCIDSLSQLIELKLNQNDLVGIVPSTLGNLSNLQILSLRLNNLVANDLEWVSHLSNLRYLDLSNIDLSQTVNWLSSISKIPSLSELYLDDCGLGQVNPKFIPHINSSTSLKILELTYNDLNASTMSWVLNVSKVVTHLDLSYNSLQHSIPDGFANMISHLQYLHLSSNKLDGSMLKYFPILCQLKDLSLDYNNLSGQLSDYIQQLCSAQNSLELLDLSSNPFSSGSLPNFSSLSSLNTLSLVNTNIVGELSFGQLPDHLEALYLGFNQLRGSMALFEVSKLASLQELDLSNNQWNGTLPLNIGQLSNLVSLSVTSNKLNGVINESHLSNLSKLKYLKVDQNSLSFNFSSDWVPPFQLTYLYTTSCTLGPKFPVWIKHQRELNALQISNSGISDSFPEWFWNLSLSLLYLNVSHNKLSGTLSKSLLRMKTRPWSVWDFRFNNLSGPLPLFPDLYSLFLSNNMFTGSVSSLCALSPLHLKYLDLSSNLLTGPLPDCWEKFQTLQVLNLAKNNLSGRLPTSLGNLQQIESLHLNNNNFFGELPSLIHCPSLKVIDFGDNNFRGTLPAWVGHNLHQLVILRLRANKFNGSIPTSLCNLIFLQVLDLSNNNITGKIPQCLGHIIALSNLKFPRKTIFYSTRAPATFDSGQARLFIDEAILAWKGRNREYGKILGLMTIIDLSCNHLSGEIPNSITTLVALAGLNLSTNNITGFIPNNIGHMQLLESLDLSFNHLYGRMPMSFSYLSFLDYMNLSFNNLSGKIPVSTQLQSFDSSTYVGNNGLCGPPLQNQCPEDGVSPTGSTERNEKDEDELITLGFYVSMSLGFCAGFWAVCGTLVIKSSWRHAYFRFFNNMNDWICVTLVVFRAQIKKRFQVQD